MDSLAAAAALRAGLAVDLVFPRGLLQEDGPVSGERLATLAGAAVHELDSPEFAYRTWAVVRLADAVLLVDPAGGDGCRETARAARSLGRPLLEVPSGRVLAAREIARWLERTGARVLTVAGCRASLLAAAGAERAVADQAEAIAAGARLARDRVLGQES